MSGGYIYILGSHTGTLYIGVTSNLYLRVMQHKEGTLEGFTAAYGCKRLLCLERYETFAQPSLGRNNSRAGGAKRSST
jgi:putative endonuclease